MQLWYNLQTNQGDSWYKCVITLPWGLLKWACVIITMTDGVDILWVYWKNITQASLSCQFLWSSNETKINSRQSWRKREIYTKSIYFFFLSRRYVGYVSMQDTKGNTLKWTKVLLLSCNFFLFFICMIFSRYTDSYSLILYSWERTIKLKKYC